MAEDAPFLRPVRVESVPEGGVEHDIEASEAERRALAKLNGLPAIGRLAARLPGSTIIGRSARSSVDQSG